MKQDKKQKNTNISGLKQGILSFGITLIVIFIVIAGVLFIQTINDNKIAMGVPQNNVQDFRQTTNEKPNSTKHSRTAAETLTMIDKYQARYFIIVKRNDMFLQGVNCGGCAKDTKDLSDLYTEVISKIDTNNGYFIKYNEIENEFAENTGETTYDMNMFANSHYEAVDKLLNEVYQAVKAKIPTEDFKNLTSSELMWIKEVEAYKKVFEAQGYGTLGTLKYLGYKTDMHRFRTLLLMLYL